MRILGLMYLAGCAVSGTELPNPDAAPGDNLGHAVALSDGAALVGAPKAGSLGAGKAVVYRRTGEDTWTQEATLLAETPSTDAQLGWSVDLDGDRAVVGALTDSSTGFVSGAAYVFERGPDGAWGQAARLLGDPTVPEDGFGYDVAISGDWAAVGSPLPPPPDFVGPGVVTVFHRGTAGWVQHAVLEGLVDLSDFGTSVSLDGDRLAVGAIRDPEQGVGAGAAWVLRREGESWEVEAKILPDDGAPFARFGSSVAISGDTLLVGARDADGAAPSSGAAYVFVRQGDTWTQEVRLTAFDGTMGAAYGRSVDLDGDRAFVGAWLERVAGIQSGAAYLHRRTATGWNVGWKFVPDDPVHGDGYGFSVAVDDDCSLVGVVNRDVEGQANAGAAVVRCG